MPFTLAEKLEFLFCNSHFKLHKLACVYAGLGCRDAKLGFNKLGNEGDERCDDGTLSCVGQADEQEGHVAEDPQSSLRKI